jgi:hypothetical protein
MRWKELATAEQFSRLLQESHNFPVVIFKHSTRCATSSVAMSRVERDHQELENFPKVSNFWKVHHNDDIGEIDFYYLDVLVNRDLSRHIAEYLGITHQSPQLLMIKNGKCVYHASHLFISLDAAVKHLKEAA